MTVQDMQDIGDRYQARFSNIDQVVHPSIMTDSRYLAMLERAVETGQELTREAIDQVFDHVPREL